MNSADPRSVPLLNWVVQLAAACTGAEAAVLMSREPRGTRAVASFGLTLRETRGWLPVCDHWVVVGDSANSMGHLIQPGPFRPGFAAAAPVHRPTEGICASLWVLSRASRRGGLSSREKTCLDLLTGLAFEPLVVYYAGVAGRAVECADRMTVLIADDEPGFRQTARTEFGAAGFGIEEAQSGRQVLRQVSETAPDIVVIDLAMPDGEGIETIRTLRAEGYSGVIVATSGAFSAQLLRTAQLLGANGCLAKPFRKGELSALVAKLLVDRWGNPGEP